MEEALAVVRDLAEEGHRCALVGGIAVSVRTVPRTTLDLDLAVAVASDAEAEELVRRMRTRGYGLYEVLEQAAVGRLATARFVCAPGEPSSVPVDLLFASSGIEPEIVAAAEDLEILTEVRLPIALRGHLLALKVLAYDEARRPQDRLDIVRLLDGATEDDLNAARNAVALIERRGFHRDKDLPAELERFVRPGKDPPMPAF